MAEHKVELSVSVALWLHLYFAGVGLCSFLTRRPPDDLKLKRMAFRAVTCKIVERKGR